MNFLTQVTNKVITPTVFKRNRYKVSKMPLAYLRTLKDKQYGNVKPLSIRQYLSLQEGKWTPYPVVHKRARKRTNGMNPFFKINQAEADEIIEYVKEQAALKKLKKKEDI